MREIYADATAKGCHEHWHDHVIDRFSDDFWTTEDGLLLLADLWPVGADITDAEVNHIRYGLLEPPVVCKAGLLTQECNIHVYENYERLLILAGKRLGDIRRKWAASFHGDTKYPPAFFLAWAKQKGFTPCWLSLWEASPFNLMLPDPHVVLPAIKDMESQNIELGEASSQTEMQEKDKYITKGKILDKKWPLYREFSQSTLEVALEETKKPQNAWLVRARGVPGKRGRNGGATWNPAKLADCLADKFHADETALRFFIERDFPAWLEEFKKLRSQTLG